MQKNVEKKQSVFVSFFLTFILIFLTNHSGKAAVTLSDIPEQYASEINYLLNQRVISGYPDGTFKPNNNVTREEAATIIGMAKGFDELKGPPPFQMLTQAHLLQVIFKLR